MQTAREESSIFIFGETLLKRESAAEELTGCLARRDKRAAAGTSVPSPITRRETVVYHKWHVRW